MISHLTILNLFTIVLPLTVGIAVCAAYRFAFKGTWRRAGVYGASIGATGLLLALAARAFLS